MYLINVRLRAPEIEGRPTPFDGQMSAREIRRLLLVLAEPDEGLEHVYGEERAGGVDLGLFIRRPTLDAAESAAARLCGRCLDGVPELAGWSLLGCGTDLALALARFETSGGQVCQRPAIAAR